MFSALCSWYVFFCCALHSCIPCKRRRRHNNGLTLHRIVRILFRLHTRRSVEHHRCWSLAKPKDIRQFSCTRTVLPESHWAHEPSGRFLMNGHANHGVTLSAAIVSQAPASISESNCRTATWWCQIKRSIFGRYSAYRMRITSLSHAGTMYSLKLVDHLLWFETTRCVFTPAALNLKQFKLYQIIRMLCQHGALGGTRKWNARRR